MALALGAYRCRLCGVKLPDRGATVDHIVELKDGGAMYDQANLQPICSPCHTKKTHKERMKRMRR
ncbi:MAG: HNH endonuclease [Pseudomonadota bacterium]